MQYSKWKWRTISPLSSINYRTFSLSLSPSLPHVCTHNCHSLILLSFPYFTSDLSDASFVTRTMLSTEMKWGSKTGVVPAHVKLVLYYDSVQIVTDSTETRVKPQEEQSAWEERLVAPWRSEEQSNDLVGTTSLKKWRRCWDRMLEKQRWNVEGRAFCAENFMSQGPLVVGSQASKKSCFWSPENKGRWYRGELGREWQDA